VIESRRKIWLLAVVAVAVIATAVIGMARLSKPRLYQGKTVQEWVALLGPQVGQEKKRDEAAWA
jgi:hypothetical protein